MNKITLTMLLLVLISSIGSANGTIAQGDDYWLKFTKFGQVSTGGDAYEIWVNEAKGLAYVTCGYSGLKIFNVSSPSSPSELSHVPEQPASIPTGHTTGYAHQFFIDSNDLVYVGDGAAGLTIINCSDPLQPSLISQYLGGYAWDIQTAGNIAYVALGWVDESFYSGLHIVNVSTPSTPFFVGDYSTQGIISDIDVENDLLFLSSNQEGLLVLNISNRTNPELVGRYEELVGGDGFFTFDMAANLVYVASWASDFRILDISDPQNLLVVGEYEGTENYSSVKIYDELAFLCAKQGLTILNVTNPANPTEIGHYSDSGRINSVYKKNDIIFLATEEDGLVVLSSSKSSSASGFELPFLLFALVSLLILRKWKVRRKSANFRDIFE
ncbi:MAG: LVIVD repeat-containing protein [Candidatus Hodarchaeales archaeon]|jgi:hypothetical protein